MLTISRFKKHKGSFVRVVETVPRYRDGARMAYIEYIDNNLEPLRVYARPNPQLEKYRPKMQALSDAIRHSMKTQPNNKTSKPVAVNRPKQTPKPQQKSMEDVD